MRFDHRVFGEWSDVGIDAAKVHGGGLGQRLAAAVDFARYGIDGAQRRIGTEGLQRRDFRAARTAQSPRRLEHARAMLSARVRSLAHAAIAAGPKETREPRTAAAA